MIRWILKVTHSDSYFLHFQELERSILGRLPNINVSMCKVFFYVEENLEKVQEHHYYNTVQKIETSSLQYLTNRSSFKASWTM